jgi:hypothetical protein
MLKDQFRKSAGRLQALSRSLAIGCSLPAVVAAAVVAAAVVPAGFVPAAGTAAPEAALKKADGEGKLNY